MKTIGRIINAIVVFCVAGMLFTYGMILCVSLVASSFYRYQELFDYMRYFEGLFYMVIAFLMAIGLGGDEPDAI